MITVNIRAGLNGSSLFEQIQNRANSIWMVNLLPCFSFSRTLVLFILKCGLSRGFDFPAQGFDFPAQGFDSGGGFASGFEAQEFEDFFTLRRGEFGKQVEEFLLILSIL